MKNKKEKGMKFYTDSIITGIILVGIGLLIWFSNLNIIHIKWSRDWPVILIAIGLSELLKVIFKKRE